MAATRTASASMTHDYTSSGTKASNPLPRTSSTNVSNTSYMQLETSASRRVATGRSPTETSVTSSIKTLTTTSSTTQRATSTSSKTELPKTDTVTSKTFTTTPVPATKTISTPTTHDSTSSGTNASNQLPRTSSTIVRNTSNMQPETYSSRRVATGRSPTETSVTSSIETLTTTASTTQRATSTSSETDFPMAGRIGLGILAILVVAGVILAIKKMTARKKRLPSIQTTADSSGHKTELSKGIPMLDVNEKDVSNNDAEIEIKMDTGNGGLHDGDVVPDTNYESIQDESIIKQSNNRVGNGTAKKDNAYSTNCQYAEVVKVGKRSPKIFGTTPESDTNTYDTTYVHQKESRDTGDDYQHIYDHANSKNPE
ncbi:hypothetical protein CHS0354_008735 [Potamilus streckersoni]|uniref:Uncharacterized protein n=1 Tax=Potamilus streckersoni TaxID=2493646 RepID=A0AAE0WF02_9BIVA|nr:hypothetical protein CHS0354_008735 [Potamilus streckersoni]